ncbi:hypothetical protein [Mesobacillus subterraneus]|uniref:Uncharacterized protein n=1 Tax=Mesobacillus subterraneus TaxID=285983 RepID=A0A427TVX8_9BACI|nr:hypothetical protein [Mesobacillus subterraneus]RSD28496.1 hypothetical protein EJA10_05285 [Mesobacillus subterraneus]
MIEKITGSIILDNENIVLSSGMSYETFLNTPLYKGGIVDKNYSLKDTQEISGKGFLVTLFFNEGKLKEVHLSEVINGLSWDNWSEDVEMTKKESHDQWLSTILGEEPYIYSWGQVESVFDKKGCVSSIIIRYY